MKIRFRRLKYVFIGTLFLSGCLFSPQKHTEIALSDAFQSILDQLYLILPQGQESYSGSVSFEVVTAKKHLQGILSGQWIFS